jgi:glycosyltransferase involved in cell wall biosynthesis
VKILITTFTYPPNKDGVAEASRVMAEGLAALGWEVTVYTSGIPTEEIEMLNGVRVQRYRLAGAWAGRSPGGAEADRYVNDVMQAPHQVLVLQCWDSWNALYLRPHLQQLACPLVIVSHGYARHIFAWAKAPSLGIWHWLRWIWWTAFRLPGMMKAAQKLIFLSERKDNGRFFDHRLATLLRHPGIEVIPNSFDENEFRIARGTFRASHGIAQNEKMFLCVANYSERKNQILALEAFHDAAIPDSTLVFIGSELNDYSSRLQETERLRQSDQKTGRVLVLHGLSRGETIQAYVDADCFVLPAKAETQPIVLLEAMAAGIPWISTDTGCVSEMPGGLVVRSRSEMAKAMRRITDEPEFALPTPRGGMERCTAEFNRTHAVTRIHTVMTECLASSNPISRES